MAGTGVRVAAVGWMVAGVLALLAGGCAKPEEPVAVAPEPAIDYSGQLGDGQLALRKIPPEQYPSFADAFNHRAGLATSIDQSLLYLSRPSSRQQFPYLDITHERALATLRALRDMAGRAGSGQEFDSLIRQNFEVYKSFGAPDPRGGFTDKVLFTGYCTPIYDASLTRTPEFPAPLYRRPADLLSDPTTGEILGRRDASGQMVSYPTRGQIEQSRMLSGNEIAWVRSDFDAYVITVQGSAKLRLADGRMLEIGYAGTNGHEYVSIGRELIKDGKLRPNELNLSRLRAYFRDNPGEVQNYLWRNPRYVFFTEAPGGPFGSLNVRVTAMRSIATDKAVYPRAMPALLQVEMPWSEQGYTRPFSGFMMDQDTGGAIRAAGRCDIYMGEGDLAERLAGHQLNEGELYYIALRPELLGQYSQPTAIELQQRNARVASAGQAGPGGTSASGGAAALSNPSRGGTNAPAVAPARSSGAGAAPGTGPSTDHLPVRDTAGSPPPGGWVPIPRDMR